MTCKVCQFVTPSFTLFTASQRESRTKRSVHTLPKERITTMDKNNIGLMEQDDTIIDNFRNAILGDKRPKTLTQLLSKLSP